MNKPKHQILKSSKSQINEHQNTIKITDNKRSKICQNVEEDKTYGEVSKKLIPILKAWVTVSMASSSETSPKTLPRGDAPKPTQLRFRPVFPNSRRCNL